MVLEVRTYRLHPGTTDAFVRLMREQAMPLLERAGIHVVGCGASSTSEDGHEEAYLLRAFASVEEHDAQESAFYDSPEWQTGPRDAVLACIVDFHSVTLEASREAVLALAADHRSGQTAGSSTSAPSSGGAP